MSEFPAEQGSADTASDQRHRISELLDRRRTGQARSLLASALAEQPDDSDLLLLGARADLIDDDPASARRTLERVIARDPGHFSARALLLMLLTAENELVPAEQLALSLLRERPAAAWLYAAYGRVMLKALQFPKARALAKEALRLDPNEEDALTVMALCDVVELPKSSNSAALRRLLAQNPEDRQTLGLVVTALIHDGKDAAALRGARELLRADPNHAHWLDVVKALTVDNHWSLKPLWPMRRFGWGGSVAIWVGGILVVRTLGQSNPQAAGILSWVIVGYVVYSWVWPPLLKRLLLR
jgi:tetratricopeptide (TPR) repeat protein